MPGVCNTDSPGPHSQYSTRSYINDYLQNFNSMEYETTLDKVDKKLHRGSEPERCTTFDRKIIDRKDRIRHFIELTFGQMRHLTESTHDRKIFCLNLFENCSNLVRKVN